LVFPPCLGLFLLGALEFISFLPLGSAMKDSSKVWLVLQVEELREKSLSKF
jgi:hypothetical protein